MVEETQANDHSHLRVTVDEVKDFELVEKLIVDYSAAQLSASQIEKILLDHPDLQKINESVVQKKVQS